VTRTYRVADLFAGAGGFSTGALRAVEALGADLDLVAVNHWRTAVATHSANHVRARHYCMDLEAANPSEIVPEGRLDLLLAAPSCTHHSRARGGKPVNDQQRAHPWLINRWLTELDVEAFVVENVGEILTWGPVNPDTGKPIASKKGAYFQAWTKSLRALGYAIEWRVLNAADFGDATTRQRFFLIGRKGPRRVIRWPSPTHSRTGAIDLFGGLPKWRAARDVIDWSNLGPSLLDRKRPLSVKTRLRIARGLQKFGGVLAPLYVRLLDLPATHADFVRQAGGGPFAAFAAAHLDGRALLDAAVPVVFANRNNAVAKDLGYPIPTVTTATGGGAYLVVPSAEPFVLGQQSDSAARSTEQPIPTVTTGGVIRVATPTAEPFLTHYYGTGGASGVEDPVATVTTKPRFGLASPLVVPYGPRAECRPADEPLPTILTKDRLGVATPVAFLVPKFGERGDQAPRVHDLADPLPTVTGDGAGRLVTPTAEPIALPSDVDPRRLVLIDGVLYLLDIRFRMLTNRELARAMGFSDDEQEYEFTGTQSEVTKQIGNAVPVGLATALVGAILGERAPARLADRRAS
jgi:DNA (cytosine-5)-methyltransferase 1